MRVIGSVVVSLLLLQVSTPQTVEAVTRRAVLIGINEYAPPATEKKSPSQATGNTTTKRGESKNEADAEPVQRDSWTNLDGAINDIEAIQGVLITRFGFRPEHIVMLKNGEATRQRILDTIQKHLIEPTAKGDVVIFVYAGHGSQVRNSQSTEDDKLDETIVPADANQGAWDIRDKELRHLFNDILDKGAQLTVVFDSCHSGSVVRGVVPTEKSRGLKADPRDIAEIVAKEPQDKRDPPEKRGALIFSAAQDHESALEATDPEHGMSHGAFHLALLRVLQTVKVDESAERIFLRAKALLQSLGKRQEPVLAGTDERRRAPLFGSSDVALSGRPAVAVLRIQEETTVVLQGGLAAGLRQGSELTKAGGTSGSPFVRLQIEKVEGWSKAFAKVIDGQLADVKPGDLFEIRNWVAVDGGLAVWWPAVALEEKELRAAIQMFSALRSSDRIQWIDDPTEVTPTHLLVWENTQWRLLLPTGEGVDVGKKPTPEQIVQTLGISDPKSVRLFVNMPPSAALLTSLKAAAGSAGNGLQLASNAAAARYVLVGGIRGGEVQYAWVLPNINKKDAETTTPLPVRTNWIALPAKVDGARTVSGALVGFARRLTQIWAWLQVTAPPDNGNFPYTLTLKEGRAGLPVTTGTLVQDTEYQLELRASAESVRNGVEPRYVYVFLLDSDGKTSLLYPPSEQGTIENRLPLLEQAGSPPPEIPLRTRITIGPPYGLDTYVLISSRDAIPNPDILEGEGVRTRDRSKETPLARLLGDVARGERGARVTTTPANWSIERVFLRSVPTAQ